MNMNCLANANYRECLFISEHMFVGRDKWRLLLQISTWCWFDALDFRNTKLSTS